MTTRRIGMRCLDLVAGLKARLYAVASSRSNRTARRMLSWRVARVFLAAWLAVFAVQASDVLMMVVPDDCTEDVRGSAADPCPDGCPRCHCCARVPIFIPQTVSDPLPPHATAARMLSPIDPFTTPSPHGVFHVPKIS
jgi:hypothetical protein